MALWPEIKTGERWGDVGLHLLPWGRRPTVPFLPSCLSASLCSSFFEGCIVLQTVAECLCLCVHTCVPEQGLHLCAAAVRPWLQAVFAVGCKVPVLSVCCLCAVCVLSAPRPSQLLFHEAGTALLAQVPSFQGTPGAHSQQCLSPVCCSHCIPGQLGSAG